jgi:hypothetical protein
MRLFTRAIPTHRSGAPTVAILRTPRVICVNVVSVMEANY